ncbi:MAG: ADP-ribosylglycohydrolase family protein [Phycisphaerales bacterium]|nr:MAG: ADP-ribosylglycohydrolase family protein [Phycisphaerales bacterium]
MDHRPTGFGISQRILIVILLLAVGSPHLLARERTITRDELRDKIHGFWVGQLVGNFMGFPFENVYVDEPVPVRVDRYFTFKDAGPDLRVNDKDLRGYSPLLMHWMEGAFGDDDTDIEFVILHAVEKHGLGITYPQIAQAWKDHINRKIWVANRTARDLMETGMLPPATGSKENNRNWFQIDPQLVNEIWSAFYPGMTEKAVERAAWSAHITNDDWGTHPTMAYAAIYSGAFFETDIDKLVQMALAKLPADSPFTEGVQDVIRWHRADGDWRVTRRRIHEKYYRYRKGDYEAPVSVVSSLCNGLCGIMAMLYGGGDFVETTAIAVCAGYDCDNQASTCAGLMGVMHGVGCIPDRFTKTPAPNINWAEPFNDHYINYTRDGLPISNRISSMVERIVKIAEQGIIDQGGRVVSENGQRTYIVNCDF